MRNHCIHSKLLSKVLVLLRSKHHFLVLSALRMFRRVVQLKDEFYFKYIIKDDVFRPIVQCFKDNGTHYNLLNSAILELFEFILTENIYSLIPYIIEKYGDDFENVTYVRTFTQLRVKYEQVKDREDDKLELSRSKSPSEDSVSSAQWKKERQADADEQWFNDDDIEVRSCIQDFSVYISATSAMTE
ncbi:hypothetical protein AB6A40_011631 [Gnathostoma spinigerum]|uniref:Serine/threonine-protein phosphatase 4 regulatory subunit 3-like central domain-containing protein n=1 Tax=Gnathostoma spinigerum TaxID=75299 RepID=A0ABD6F4M6_9BILA